jgi:cell division septation protein DedD
MRSILDTEEREPSDTEITLGTGTLLSIFFGLAVVCGVFFGFGYFVGHRATPSQPASTATVADSSAPATDPHTGKPSAVQAALTTTTTPDTHPTGDSTAAPPETTPSPSTDSRSVTVTEPQETAAAPRLIPPPADGTNVPSASAAGPAHTMVQIAAVSHQEDADVLVSALRKRGYGVSVRNEPQDRLLHVQVGPFASRSEALAMKQKLQADGYNAIVKP